MSPFFLAPGQLQRQRAQHHCSASQGAEGLDWDQEAADVNRDVIAGNILVPVDDWIGVAHSPVKSYHRKWALRKMETESKGLSCWGQNAEILESGSDPVRLSYYGEYKGEAWIPRSAAGPPCGLISRSLLESPECWVRRTKGLPQNIVCTPQSPIRAPQVCWCSQRHVVHLQCLISLPSSPSFFTILLELAQSWQSAPTKCHPRMQNHLSSLLFPSLSP